MRFLSVIIIYLLLLHCAWANHVVNVKDRHTHRDLSSQVEYIQASPEFLWPWEVSSLPGWQTAEEYPAFGLDSRPYWFRLGLRNTSGEMQVEMLDVRHSMLDVLDVFALQQGRIQRVWRTGLQRGLESRPYPAKSFVIPLTLETDEEVELYFRAQSDSYLMFPVDVQDIRIFANQQAMGKMQIGMVSGVFLLVGLYALLMYGFIRERRFIYYALFCLSLILTTWILKGYAGLFDFVPEWLNSVRFLLVTSGILLASLIMSSLDMFRVWLPNWLRVATRAVLGVVIGCSLVLWLFPIPLAIYLTFASYLVVTLLAFSYVVLFTQRGGWLQRLYCYSWLGFMLGCLSFFANRFAWLTNEWLSDYLLSAFSAMAALLLCFSLAYRTYQEKKGRMRAKRQASEGLKRYFELYHSANEGLFTSTLEGQLLAANPAYCRMFGYDDVQSMALTVGRTTHLLYVKPTERDELLAQLFSSPKEGVRSDVEMRHRDGSTFWARISLRISRREGKNRAMLLEGILVDITESKQYQAKLEYLANHDEATGLYNRRYLIHSLEELFKRRKLNLGTDYLCFIDIDHFKVINEGGGHLAGDEFLRQIANHVANLKRDNFLLTRLSGDEFAVIMENSYIDEVIQYVERWRKAIQELKFVWNGKIYSVTASLGVVPIHSGCNDASALMALADAACSTAKRQGRNRIHVYSDLSPEMRLYQEEVAWVARIHQALEERSFVLARQLIVPTKGQSKGLKYEILIRLRAEDGELIQPAQFIGAAERFGLMPAIDLWVLENLLNWYAANPDELARLDMVSVNLSGESIGTPKLHRKIRHLLEAAHFPYQRLCFEITESQAIANIESTKNFIEAFKELGCSFALDDFGSGFSSYGHLKELPIDLLKIDGQFVRHLDTSETDRAIVNSMAELARAVGVKTVAEYVENQVISERLTAMGVDYLQGFAIHQPTLLSEPLPALVFGGRE